MRIHWMEKLFHKIKYNKKKRDEWREVVAKSDAEIDCLLMEGFVPALDKMPEVKAFLEECDRKEAEEQEKLVKKQK